jgi:hypothetical protein
MPWQRRGDFSALIERLRTEHGYVAEIKWMNVKARAFDFYVDLVQTFFSKSWGAIDWRPIHHVWCPNR